MKYACLFPGQGSQSIGMGKELADGDPLCRDVFSEADAALGISLSTICWQGPEELLVLTENTQPAILATSVAAWRRFHRLREEQGLPAPSVYAGHSLGEYSALVAAESLAFGDAVRLVRERGRLMQEAVPVGTGAMAAVLGPDAAAVEQVAADAQQQSGEVCAVANYNAPGQTVIAGTKAAVELAVELAKAAGAKRSILLPVSAPFHCPLMERARAGMQPLLEATEFKDPVAPVVCNVDAELLSSGEAIREALVRQIVGAVRWTDSVQRIIDLGVEGFVEVGSGSVLSGLNRRIDRTCKTIAAGSPDQVDAALEFVGSGG